MPANFKCLFLTAAVIAAVVFACTPLASAAPKASQRTGEKPCREGMLGIVSMLDAKTDDSADYRQTYAAIVETCGPIARRPNPKTRRRAAP